jgi:hemolysin III
MDKNETWLSRHITLHNNATQRDEYENFVTHSVGTLASIGFLIFVCIKYEMFAAQSTWIGMVIYGVSLVLLYLSSSIYHITPRGDIKRLFRIFDHASIYFLIAGTYTPILLYIGNPVTYRITIFVWSVAAVGILFSLIFWGRFKILHILFYILMGWMIIFFWDDIVPYIPSALIWWILAAGVTYTTGVIFYAVKKIAHNHMIWHIFCVLASIEFCIGFLLHLTA